MIPKITSLIVCLCHCLASIDRWALFASGWRRGSKGSHDVPVLLVRSGRPGARGAEIVVRVHVGARARVVGERRRRARCRRTDLAADGGRGLVGLVGARQLRLLLGRLQLGLVVIVELLLPVVGVVLARDGRAAVGRVGARVNDHLLRGNEPIVWRACVRIARALVGAARLGGRVVEGLELLLVLIHR